MSLTGLKCLWSPPSLLFSFNHCTLWTAVQGLLARLHWWRCSLLMRNLLQWQLRPGANKGCKNYWAHCAQQGMRGCIPVKDKHSKPFLFSGHWWRQIDAQIQKKHVAHRGVGETSVLLHLAAIGLLHVCAPGHWLGLKVSYFDVQPGRSCCGQSASIWCSPC